MGPSKHHAYLSLCSYLRKYIKVNVLNLDGFCDSNVQNAYLRTELM